MPKKVASTTPVAASTTSLSSSKPFGAKGLAWFKVEADGTLQSTIAKNFKPELLKEIGSRLKAEPGDLLLFIADTWKVTCKALYALRQKIGAEMKLYDPKTMNFSWVVEFPMFDFDDEEKRWVAMHHPFTSPRDTRLRFARIPTRARAARRLTTWSSTAAKRAAARFVFTIRRSSKRFFHCWESTRNRPRSGSAFCSAHSSSALRRTAASRSASIAGSCSSAASTTSAIASPSPKRKRASDLMTGAPGDVEAKQLKELGIKVDL